MRKFLAFVGRSILVTLSSVIALVGLFAAFSINEPIVLGLLCCVVFAGVYFVRLAWGIIDRPLQDIDRWFSFASLAVLCMGAIWGLSAEYSERRQPPRAYPAFNELHVSSGILRKAIGSDFYLKRKGLPDLGLICPRVFGGKQTVRSCDYTSEIPYKDRNVTVYHTMPKKAVLWKATYYEMRAGKTVIVPYDKTIDWLRDQDERRRKIDYGFWAFLFTWGLYMPLEYAIRRRRQNKRPKPLDEPITTTQ